MARQPVGHRVGLVERACELAAAIAEPNRMKMIKVLGSHPPRTVTVSEVARQLGISQPTATKHLQILHQAGFVRRERDGNRVHYSLDTDTVAEFHQIVEYAFAHATTPCVNEYDCLTCPYQATCV